MAKGERRKIARAKIDGGRVAWNFADGSKIEFDTGTLENGALHMLAAVGMSRLVQSAFVKADDPKAAAEEVIASIEAGNWKPGREKKEKGPTDLAVAVSTVVNKPLHVVIEMLASKSRQEKGKLAQHPQVAAEIARMQAERAKEKAKAAKKAPALELDF